VLRYRNLGEKREYQNANRGVNSQDFIAERGGNPEKIRESQRKRNANVEIVDEIIADWEDHRKSRAPRAHTANSHTTATRILGEG
jgi:seryl-tRNA synthetase